MDKIRETLAFKDLTPEEKERRGILGRLYGPIADVVNPTRNGRAYSDELWTNVFQKNPIVKELLAKGGIPGELDHPADRDDVCSEKIAIIMPEAPKKDDKGHLIGYFDILDTPCGKIAYQLAKYGFQLGVSSRGNGDVLSDDSVDPETYEFKCFDLVLIPSVEAARMTMVEGLDTKDMRFKKALKESLNASDAHDKQVMQEALKDLNIKLDEDLKGQIEETRDDKFAEGEISKQVDDESKEAKIDGSAELIRSLQEALRDKAKLESTIQSLQEKLAVSNTKVTELEESIELQKKNNVRLAGTIARQNAVAKNVSSLEAKLEAQIKLVESKDAEIIALKTTKAKEAVKLTESLNTKKDEFKVLTEKLESEKKEHAEEVNKLNEALEKERQSSSKRVAQLNEQIKQAQKAADGYKKLATNTVNNYIQAKATMLDVTPEEIKNRLPESYTLRDVDRVCDSLQEYSLNMNKLPFRVDREVKVSIKPATNEALQRKTSNDEAVDDFTLKLAGLL